MKKDQKKLIIVFSIIISIFVIGIVLKDFQNDTFFNIAIGKHILENGIDMKDHFNWVDKDLHYTYSHWSFDIITYLIYSNFGFVGIYIAIILFTILIGITLFILLSKRNNSPVISFFVTLISLYVIRECFTARSQIISFFLFIIEIYCIEQFVETNKKKYAIIIIVLSIIVANFHAATWPLIVILFMPYIVASICNICTLKSIYKININRLNKKIKKLPETSEKIKKYQKDIEYYKNLINPKEKWDFDYKTIRREHYNTKNLLILMIIVSLTGLVTPIGGTPYTYIIKSMFGPSNFNDGTTSIDYILEMQPTIPVSSLGFVAFTILLLGFLIFLPSKLKLEHGFLLLGLYIMSLMSRRYVYLLVLLGSYVLNDLLVYIANLFVRDDIEILEKLFVRPCSIIVLFILVCIFTINKSLENLKINYVDETLYPIKAVEYIKENLDYENIRIYNSYNNGSYLMLHEIPVFIDSRLDVYCSEFNNTDIFYDFAQVNAGRKHYKEVFNKYDFTHILIYNVDIVYPYVKEDINYNILYQDEYFTLFQKNNV